MASTLSGFHRIAPPRIRVPLLLLSCGTGSSTGSPIVAVAFAQQENRYIATNSRHKFLTCMPVDNNSFKAVMRFDQAVAYRYWPVSRHLARRYSSVGLRFRRNRKKKGPGRPLPKMGPWPVPIPPPLRREVLAGWGVLGEATCDLLREDMVSRLMSLIQMTVSTIEFLQRDTYGYDYFCKSPRSQAP